MGMENFPIGKINMERNRARSKLLGYYIFKYITQHHKLSAQTENISTVIMCLTHSEGTWFKSQLGTGYHD